MMGPALEWQAIQPNDRVLDLFCGLGFLPCRWRNAPLRWQA
jgi:tRNA/tmRNA/rRNA uracil-C5-methylase (TrmA/RlmC/RlmD family)